MFESRVLRKIFGSEMDDVTGNWRKPHNGKHCELYSSPNIIRMVKWRMRWAGNGLKRGAHRILMGKPERKRPLGISRHRWKDNIKMDLRKICWECVDWNNVLCGSFNWWAVLNAVMNSRLPLKTRVISLPNKELLPSQRPCSMLFINIRRYQVRSRCQCTNICPCSVRVWSQRWKWKFIADVDYNSGQAGCWKAYYSRPITRHCVVTLMTTLLSHRKMRRVRVRMRVWISSSDSD